MNKELQDYVWACLPKEFKEEVKKIWEHENKELVPIDALTALNGLFGRHNLTSDAEGEEMLTVSRKRVQELYNKFNHSFDNVVSDNLIGHYRAKIGLLRVLFGSKCLPDEDPKPIEPKEATSPNDNNSDIDIAGLVARGYVPDPAQHFDHILKAGLSKERRLNIAAQMMQGLICAPPIPGVDPNPPAEHLACTAFILADALIAQSELTDKQKEK